MFGLFCPDILPAESPVCFSSQDNPHFPRQRIPEIAWRLSGIQKPMKKIWIVGAGHFGLRALKKLSENQDKNRFVLVDPLRENLEQGKISNCRIEQEDGVVFLEKYLHPENAPDWIIPALPLHLAAEWCLRRLERQAVRIPLPPELEPILPNPMRGNTGDMYVSHATFRCPDDCPEPRNICTVTQKPRKKNLFEILGNIRLPGFQSFVIRSHQLGAGIGGYRPQQLFDLLNRAENTEGNLIISTACRCHGVMTGIQNS
jgi:hypothetical protein